jgi:tRNA pseudouridine38-40 synthase
VTAEATVPDAYPRQRIALGVAYDGRAYNGWQSQADGKTVQDQLERSLQAFTAGGRPSTLCAGRTDSGVHGLMQVVHFDTDTPRDTVSWMRGTNRYLPRDISVQWARVVPPSFHARASAITRRYAYILYAGGVRPTIDCGRVGWIHRPVDTHAMQSAAACLAGTHDFSSFRAAQCQSHTPVKTLSPITMRVKGSYVRLDFEANAFLHHMIRNIMGCLVDIGLGRQQPDWLADVLAAKSRKAASPTFSADGLYFLGPTYASSFDLPTHCDAFDGLPI